MAAAGSLVAALAACSSLRYVTQTAIGGVAVLCKRQPIEKVLRRGGLDDERRRQLELVLEIREFAVRELGLPDNRSYRSYVELGRDVVTWNVTAAPELSVEPVTWCFPIAGCVSYRGYFAERRARAFAERLRARDLDVTISGAIAYSTLGWFADPVLDTFFRYPDWQLAGLVFHELSHQVVYLPGDTTFNESFATAVEELGVERWLAARAGEGEVEAASVARREERVLLDRLLHTRACLDEVYRGALDEGSKRERKAVLLEDLRAELARLRASGELGPRFDPWLLRAPNNADLAAVADYESLVPAFRRLFERAGGFEELYREARELARLEMEERASRLESLSPRQPAIGRLCPSSGQAAVERGATGARAWPGTAPPDPGSR
jgi:predicted aminopeptidase